MGVDLKMKNNQLSLPFGRPVPNKPQAKSPIKLTELKEHGLAQATTHAAEVILELSKRYSDESDLRFGLIQSPDDIHSTFRSELNSSTETIFMLATLNVKHFITTTKMLLGLPTVRQAMRWATLPEGSSYAGTTSIFALSPQKRKSSSQKLKTPTASSALIYWTMS